MNIKNFSVGIVGLGYVGLPLAIEFGKKVNVLGYDNNKQRVSNLKKNKDSNFEIKKSAFKKSKKLKFTYNISELKNCNIFIITLPTPINKNKKPDLSILKKVLPKVSKIIKKNSIIVFESTVYPGCTEEICIPIIQKNSGLKFNKDFFCGYSPERINVGDNKHSLTNVKKVISASNKETLSVINLLYSKIIKAGTFPVESIKIAEAAKIIENVQRDINIALINEISIIFDRLNIDIRKVTKAAKTKWNYMDFKPGMVGGHCIGVDPYYLSYKAIRSGYTPKMILSGRNINDEMSNIYFKRIIKFIKKKNLKIKKSRILILGATFKENCNDTRNSKVFDLIKNFQSIDCKIDLFDPWIDYRNIKFPKIRFINKLINQKYDYIILCVAHNIFKKFTSKKFKTLSKKNTLIFDLKNFLNIKINNLIQI